MKQSLGISTYVFWPRLHLPGGDGGLFFGEVFDIWYFSFLWLKLCENEQVTAIKKENRK